MWFIGTGEDKYWKWQQRMRCPTTWESTCRLEAKNTRDDNKRDITIFAKNNAAKHFPVVSGAFLFLSATGKRANRVIPANETTTEEAGGLTLHSQAALNRPLVLNTATSPPTILIRPSCEHSIAPRRGNTDMQPFCSPDPLRTLKGTRSGCGAVPKNKCQNVGAWRDALRVRLANDLMREH